jgi:hypothetical protein
MTKLRFKITPFWVKIKEPTLFVIHIQEDKWKIWYEEMKKRFLKLCRLEWEEEKKYIEEVGLFDIDESMALWQMSYNHFKEMDKFLFDYFVKNLK